MDIKDFEVEISREIDPLSRVIVPFAWITRSGTVLQDHALTIGESRTKEILDKYKSPLKFNDLFDHWIRIEGLLITVNCEICKAQERKLYEFLMEFPLVYKRIGGRIQFVSTKFDIEYNINGLKIDRKQGGCDERIRKNSRY